LIRIIGRGKLQGVLKESSFVKIRNSSDVYENVRKRFKLVGSPRFYSNDVVAMKPNLCCIKVPETGATTNLRVVEKMKYTCKRNSRFGYTVPKKQGFF